MRYAFYFGYEEPWEQESNFVFGGDSESTAFFLISAASETEALELGVSEASRFVAALYESKLVAPSQPWREGGFAHWTEEVDETQCRALQEKALAWFSSGTWHHSGNSHA